jgi:hypothetical protein
MGLAFALVLTHITALAIATLIDQSPDPDTTMMAIVCAFGSVGGLLGSCVRVRGEE